MRSFIEQFKEYIDCYEDAFDRVHAIMDLGRQQAVFGQQPESAKLVPGCQSSLYVWGEQTVCGHWHFAATSDGLFSSGMAQLVVNAANGHSSAELADFGIDWFKDINLTGLITSSRMNGFYNLIKVVNAIVNQR